MTALKAARAFTGRAKIAKVEGAYHGTYDYAEASQSPTPDVWGRSDNPNSVPLAVGTPEGVLADVVIIRSTIRHRGRHTGPAQERHRGCTAGSHATPRWTHSGV